MRSGPSSPSPAAPSSDDTTEVSMGLADEARIRMSPPFRSHRNLEGGNLSETMSNEPNVEAESDLSASEAGAGAGAGAEKNTRSKIFINGYFMSFEKISSSGRKIYWRCRYKSTCKARLHTDINTGEKESIRKHNHSVASDEEIKLYGLDPLTIVQDEIYEIDTVPDSQELRSVRKRSAARMVGARTSEMQNSTIETAEIPNASAGSSDPSNMENVNYDAPALVDEALLQMNPSPSASLSCACSNELPTNSTDEDRTDPFFQQTSEIADQLLRIMRPELDRLPRSAVNPTTHFDFFLAMLDGLEEHIFTLMRIERRDENHLKEAIERFCGRQCAGPILFYVSPGIRFVLSQTMLNDWENNQFFMLDTVQPNRWYLAYVPI